MIPIILAVDLTSQFAGFLHRFDNIEIGFIASNDRNRIFQRKPLGEECLNSLPNLGLNEEAATRSPPVKVSTSDPASKIIHNMLKNNIGSVIVIEDDRPVGIITEKDLLNRVIMAQREPERTYAKEIMSTPVVTIDANKPLTHALKIMWNKEIRRLAVVKEGSLMEILTERRVLEKFTHR